MHVLLCILTVVRITSNENYNKYANCVAARVQCDTFCLHSPEKAGAGQKWLPYVGYLAQNDFFLRCKISRGKSSCNLH